MRTKKKKEKKIANSTDLCIKSESCVFAWKSPKERSKMQLNKKTNIQPLTIEHEVRASKHQLDSPFVLYLLKLQRLCRMCSKTNGGAKNQIAKVSVTGHNSWKKTDTKCLLFFLKKWLFFFCSSRNCFHGDCHLLQSDSKGKRAHNHQFVMTRTQLQNLRLSTQFGV